MRGPPWPSLTDMADWLHLFVAMANRRVLLILRCERRVLQRRLAPALLV